MLRSFLRPETESELRDQAAREAEMYIHVAPLYVKSWDSDMRFASAVWACVPHVTVLPMLGLRSGLHVGFHRYPPW